MSQTEIHTGTLVPIQSIETLEELKAFATKNNIVPEYYDSLDDYLDELREPDVVTSNHSVIFVKHGDDSKYLYVYSNKQIFKFENHEEHENYDINSWTKGDDGKINFVTSFYNGGTCFSELLEDGLGELLSDKQSN